MAKKKGRDQAINAFNADPKDEKSSGTTDLRESKKIKITDPEAVKSMKEILAIRKQLEEYIETHVEPLARQLKKHQMRATGVQSEERVHSLEFWDRLHDLGLIDNTTDVTWRFDFEEKDGADPDIWIAEASKEQKEEMPAIIKYLLKALGADGSFEEEE